MDFSSLSDEDVQRMERRAWREAARGWVEYREADIARRRNPSGDHGLAQLLHDAGWEGENYWRALHDERVKRGLPIPPEGETVKRTFPAKDYTNA